ncbi:hypothetical protein Tco_0400972 [Tanacetum coccineum]
MHNNIMAAGSKERPPMLGPGRYSQWHSRFLRYLDTKTNGEYLRKCIFDGPYLPTNVLIAAENILPVAAHEEVETIHNMTAENKLYFQAEKEAIFLILTGIGDEIYSTVDACNTAKEMWTAIERLQQGESLNLNSRNLNANAVCAECGTCVFNSNHDACVSRYLKDVNARTKKPHVVPISASKPKRKANKSVATPHKKTVASDTTIQKSKSYYKKLYENTNQELKRLCG